MAPLSVRESSSRCSSATSATKFLGVEFTSTSKAWGLLRRVAASIEQYSGLTSTSGHLGLGIKRKKNYATRCLSHPNILTPKTLLSMDWSLTSPTQEVKLTRGWVFSTPLSHSPRS